MILDDLAVDENDGGIDSFYISFGDLMVILCVFFVMLLTMSKIEIGSFEKIKSAMTGSTKNTLVELNESLKHIINDTPGIPGATVRLDSDGVRVDLDTGMLFEQGKSSINSEAVKAIKPILIEILSTDYLVDIEGHTDDVPYYRVFDGETESNWSLSGKRASSMIAHLSTLGFIWDRLRIVGYASTRPLTSIEGLQGTALEKARSRNRRVSLLVR